MGHTEQSKQEAINKILSFTYEELENWIRSRLHGDDKFFSIYEGHETNLRGFLTDAFHHIKSKTFRDNFLEILDDLVSELRKYSAKEIEQDKDYIYELLTLCGSIGKFRDTVTLYKLAKSGKLKPFKLRDTDLHLVLLTTLLSYRSGGNYKFWIEQMQDESNKYYTNAAFYALLKHGYRLDILFDHIRTFIHRFKGGIELELGIEALFDYYEPKKIYSMFVKIEFRLSKEQKEAVNHAFKEAGYDAVYKLDKIPAKDYQYIPRAPQLQYIRAPVPQYEAIEPLKASSAEIFKLMGFEVEINHKIADHIIDIFAKRKKNFTSSYEYWICQCQILKKTGKHAFYHFDFMAKAVREELEKPGYACDQCQFMIISEKGFTKAVLQAAPAQGIVLKTYNQLLTDLKTFYARQKPLMKDLQALFSQ